jgi:CRP/FNR family transcriptional regulator, cyclic AMP receptor protein
MISKRKPPFDPKVFLSKVNGGRAISDYRKDQIIYTQGEPADSVFYIQSGKVKATVVSEQGKEAVVAILGADDFFGEGCLAGQPLRLSTVSAMTECVIVRIAKADITRVIHEEPAFAELFISHLLSRNSRVEEDLVDQLFNSSEKRLARVLLLLANFVKEGRPEVVPQFEILPHLRAPCERPYWDHGPEASQAPARPQPARQTDSGVVGRRGERNHIASGYPRCRVC